MQTENIHYIFKTIQYVPGKMMHHFSWFQHFLKPILHFTGASFLCVTRLLFGSPSFYRNIILLARLCPPNMSPSFYDSTFKNFSSVHHFTGSLCYTETNRNQQKISHKTRWRRTESALFVGKQYCLHYFTEFEPELQCAYSWVVSSWNFLHFTSWVWEKTH